MICFKLLERAAQQKKEKSYVKHLTSLLKLPNSREFDPVIPLAIRHRHGNNAIIFKSLQDLKDNEYFLLPYGMHTWHKVFNRIDCDRDAKVMVLVKDYYPVENEELK